MEALGNVEHQVVNAYQSHVSISMIAMQHGVSRTTVRRFLRRKGVYHKPQRKYSEEIKKSVVEEAMKGRKMTVLSKEYVIPGDTIGRWVAVCRRERKAGKEWCKE